MMPSIEDRLEALESARYSVRTAWNEHEPFRPTILTYEQAVQKYHSERTYAPDRYRNSVRIFDHSTIPPTDVTKGPLR